jgi:hypothetical protein
VVPINSEKSSTFVGFEIKSRNYKINFDIKYVYVYSTLKLPGINFLSFKGREAV